MRYYFSRCGNQRIKEEYKQHTEIVIKSRFLLYNQNIWTGAHADDDVMIQTNRYSEQRLIILKKPVYVDVRHAASR